MADAPSFEVTCPCCKAVLTIDPGVRAVLGHREAPKTGPLSTLDKALDVQRGAAARRDAAFKQAADAEKNRAEVLGKKFAHGLERAKDSPDPPVRRYDYD
jgi:hypothetical protein